jgi:hypothetical protein
LGACKFKACYGPVSKIAAYFWDAQDNPMSAQNIPWVGHLHSRLRGNVGYKIHKIILPPLRLSLSSKYERLFYNEEYICRKNYMQYKLYVFTSHTTIVDEPI